VSLIVAARFDTFQHAESAARRLFGAGFAEDDVSIFFVNPAGHHDIHPLGGDESSDAGARNVHIGAIAGAGLVAMVGALLGTLLWLYVGASPYVLVLAVCVGAYIGSLAGGLLATRTTARRPRAGHSAGVRKGGVLAAVHATPETEADAARILKAEGGLDVEKAGGRWRNGDWVDFNPLAAPRLSDKVAPSPDNTTATVN
jgi:F0F1-type ATP synthase assembly protein I